MSKRKIFLLLVTVIVFSIIGGWYYVFIYSKNHHRDAANEKGIVVNAADVAAEYQANEQSANAKYLDKALEVTGEVMEVGKNQEGKTTVALKTNDIMTTVFCTLKDSTANVLPNQKITIKGICIGFISDVKIKDAIIIK
jgi:flagellar basal body-associated protein FliL